MAEVAKKHGCPLAIRAEDGDLSALAELSDEVRGAGVEDLVLDPGTAGLAGDLAAFTQLRRLALKKGARALGYPIFAALRRGHVGGGAGARHAGRRQVRRRRRPRPRSTRRRTTRSSRCARTSTPTRRSPSRWSRSSTRSAPPTADSPVLITTNFSLTYFSVSGEVEGAGMPAWLLVADSDGQSVLTAWAAGKFDAEKIAKTVKDSGIESRISHKKLVIPGHVAGLSGEVEEELPGWQIMVGPRDAVDIPNYLKNVWSA